MAALLDSPVDRAFWLGEVGSGSTADGIARATPLSPPPLPLQAPSGLARPQQLLLAQRVFGVPAAPAWHAPDGGLVLDRALLSAGAATWWGSVTARLRAQRAWEAPATKEGRPHAALAQASAYGLTARARVSLPRRSLLRAAVQLDTLEGLFPPRGAAGSDAAALPTPAQRHPPRARASFLSLGLLPAGHELRVEAAAHEKCSGTGPRGGASELVAPLVASLSVSNSSRGRGLLRYRAGLVTAPPSAGGVRGGGLRLHAQAGATLGASASRTARPVPRTGGANGNGIAFFAGKTSYSAVPQQSRVVLSGLAGVLARTPLPPLFAPSSSASHPPPPPPAPSSHPLECAAFGSVALSASVGRFSRPFFDLAALTLRLDAVSATPGLDGAGPSSSPPPQPHFSDGAAPSKALRTGAWATASLCVQLLGPLRARADLRVPLENVADAARSENGRRAGALARRGEAVLGLDCPLPPFFGSARAVAWYDPARQQAMVEMRLLDL